MTTPALQVVPKLQWHILRVLLPFVVIIFAYIGMMAMGKSQQNMNMMGGMQMNATSN